VSNEQITETAVLLAHRSLLITRCAPLVIIQ